MFNLPLRPQQVVGPASVILLAALLFLFEPQTSQWLAYDRIMVSSHEWWRLLSANLLHTNLNHLLLNSAGLALLWALHGDHYSIRRFFNLFVLCYLGCTAGLYFFAENLIWYVGLSGTLHGIFVWGAMKDIQQHVSFGGLLFIGVWEKILYEQLSEPNLELANLINADVAIDAHLYGAITGLAVFSIGWGWDKLSSSNGD